MRARLLPTYGLTAMLMLVLTFAACDGGGDGGPPPGSSLPVAWVWIKSQEPQGDIVQASHVTLSGSAYCDTCPPDDAAFGYCPAEKPSPPTAINVTVINKTTGQSAELMFHEVGGRCSCLFSYCTMIYAHRWAAYYVPLTWGGNVIVATASGPSVEPGTESITITRVPGTVGNLKATSGKQQVTLSWDPVPDAVSYNIYWSTSQDFSNATRIAGATSPYTQTGLTDGQTYYFLVTSVADGTQSMSSQVVAATPGWVKESVAATASSWTTTSIATDSAGKAHIHYSNLLGTGSNYYVTNVTGVWSSLLVDQSPGPFYSNNADIALDSLSTVHVSFVNASGLTHAVYASGAWLRELVDSSASCDASVALDAANKTHIAYYTPTSLRYATNSSGAWTNVVVEDFGFQVNCGERTGGSLSLGVDADGAAHIAYQRRYTTSISYATNRGGLWTVSYLSLPVDGFTGLSLAVDPSRAVHIVYSGTYPSALMYAHNVSGAWTVEAIQSLGASSSPSLSLDADGKAHVSYHSLGPYELRYANNSSGTWYITTIESDVFLADTDIAVDSQEKAHITYSMQQGDIRYATNK